MNIGMVLSKFPPVVGGPGSVAYTLSKELIKDEFKVTVITQKFPGLKDYEVMDGIKIYRKLTPFSLHKMGVFNHSRSVLSLGLFIKKILQKEKCDILHSHDVTLGGQGGLLSLKFKKIPSVVKYGGDMVYELLDRLRVKNWDCRSDVVESWKYPSLTIKLAYNLQKYMFNEYDFIYSDTEYGYNLLKNHLKINQEKLKVVRNAIDFNEFHPDIKTNVKERLGIKNKIMVFCATRLIPLKAIDKLIRAISIVNKENKDAFLVIGGEGSERENLEELSKKLGCEKNVLFSGTISREKMPEFYSACDIYAQPSYFDLLPNSILEAMACGKPCIGTNIETYKEVINDGYNGFLVDINEEQIAEKLLVLINNNKLREEFGKRSLEIVRKEFTLEKLKKGIIEIYEKLA